MRDCMVYFLPVPGRVKCLVSDELEHCAQWLQQKKPVGWLDSQETVLGGSNVRMKMWSREAQSWYYLEVENVFDF